MNEEKMNSAEINNRKKNYFKNVDLIYIDSISNITPLKSVFNRFLSDENIEEGQKNKGIPEYKKMHNDIVYKYKNQAKKIKELYKIDNTVFNQILYEKESEKVIHDELIARKKNSKKNLKINFDNLEEKIFAGTLDFLDLEDKNLELKKLNNIKKDYLIHSSNFFVAKNKSEAKNYGIFSPQKIKKNSLMSKTNYNFHKRRISKNLENEENNKINNIKDNTDSLLTPTKTIYSLKNFSSVKRPQTGINSTNKIPIKLTTNNIKSRNKGNYFIKGQTIDFNSYDNIYADLYLSKASIDSLQFKKEMNKTKNELVSKLIKNVERPNSRLENQLLRIIDRSNKVKNRELLKSEKDKIKKDIEIITGIKVKLRNKKTKAKKFLIETINGQIDEKRKKAMLKISDKLMNMNDETALKFADDILTSYFKKTRKGKYFSPKTKKYTKYNFNMQIREHLNYNQNKMERMMLSLDKLKNKFDL